MSKILEKDDLEKLRKDLGFRDKGIFEKTVCAINLLCDLIGFYPKLIFKGGTSLLLYKFPPVRFSIDIDILLNEEDRDSLMKNLQVLVGSSGVFKSVEEDKRESEIPIPKAHYKFFYDSQFSPGDRYILLDIVFCEPPYYRIVRKELNELPLVLAETDAIVNIPTPEGLFADKIAAISPGTIGISLDEQKEMEFVKQVIDLGALFDLSDNLSDIKRSFAGIVAQENEFRGGTFTQEEILDDIVDVAFKCSQSRLRGANNSFDKIANIDSGFRRLSNHLVTRYPKADLKLAFSKIAYICRLLQEVDSSEIIKEIDYQMIEGKQIDGNYSILERLRKTNPQAHFFLDFGIWSSNNRIIRPLSRSLLRISHKNS